MTSHPGLADEHADPAVKVASREPGQRRAGSGCLVVSSDRERTRKRDAPGAAQVGLDGRISVFIGQSGVGKSSLVNASCRTAGRRVGRSTR